MSRTRNNTNVTLTANLLWEGVIDRTNNLSTIAVTAVASNNSQLIVTQYNDINGDQPTSFTVFNMIAGTTYNFGQIVLSPFFNVTVRDMSRANHVYTVVKTVLYPNYSNNSQLQFVDTQQNNLIAVQGFKGNVVNNITIAANGTSDIFSTTTYSNNSVICYQDTHESATSTIIIQGSSTENGNDWVVIGAFVAFATDGNNRYAFSSIRMAAFKRIRIVNASPNQVENVICSLFSS